MLPVHALPTAHAFGEPTEGVGSGSNISVCGQQGNTDVWYAYVCISNTRYLSMQLPVYGVP